MIVIIMIVLFVALVLGFGLGPVLLAIFHNRTRRKI